MQVDVCDICGRIIRKGDVRYTVLIEPYNTGKPIKRKLDLCSKCYERIRDIAMGGRDEDRTC